ncbi:rod shape-determining protein MreD [Silvibacterium sp.]|uniref:rod shape-determining protein MreD n=1 Tax=Silvibacterium sp. TaxID=1964179 RepID=UPI0039E48841
MALMASTRREADEQTLPIWVYLVLPLLALGLQSLVTLHFSHFGLLDLPLLVVVYFGTARRNPVGATLGGMVIGILQDALTHQPIGVFGLAKSFIGYLAASVGAKLDTDAHGSRLLLTFCFVFLHNGIDWVLMSHMLARPMGWNWILELISAAINAVVAVVLFALLDRTRSQE